MEDKNIITKQQHDKFAEHPRYKLGDRVLLHDPKVPVGKTAKLHRTWTGPFEILETYDNFLYKLKNCQTGKIIKSRIHSNRLKPVVERKWSRHRTRDITNSTNATGHATCSSADQQPTASSSVNTGSAHTPQSTAAVCARPVTNSNSRVSAQATLSDGDPAIDVFYSVKDVTRKRFIRGKPHYFVHWEGDFPPSWEPECNLTESALAAFKKKNKQRKRKT
jgi:hypothetical protein